MKKNIDKETLNSVIIESSSNKISIRINRVNFSYVVILNGVEDSHFEYPFNDYEEALEFFTNKVKTLI